MSSAAGIAFLLLATLAVSPATGQWWWQGLIWSEQQPESCPSVNNETHVCRSLHSGNFTCVTIACCSYFEDHEDSVEYDGKFDDSDENDDEYNIYYAGSTDNCPQRKWRAECECENGGECRAAHGQTYCDCPLGFSGSKCEIVYQPAECPKPNSFDGVCGEQCTESNDCISGNVCCREGCATVCRRTAANHCTVENGRTLQIGDIHRPDSCTTCECMADGEVACSAMTCTQTDREPIIRCPSDTIKVNVNAGSMWATINDRVSGIHAMDGQGVRLQVTYHPSLIPHCECKERWSKTASVQASAIDKYGQAVSCEFKVAVEVGSILGGLFLLAVISVLVFCCCRRRQHKAREQSHNHHGHHGIDNNIYHVPADVKLPPYSEKAPSVGQPPAYSTFGSMKGMEYMYHGNARFDNPGYSRAPSRAPTGAPSVVSDGRASVHSQRRADTASVRSGCTDHTYATLN
ncbi:hypothetical protein MAR_012354 [Mya arenaria]|uniref:EGF-like domain-containing protein n=1 Tax=Mya arenaria TaxID=6604 RepID=A0ABY7FWR7_MYAAR|nr:hypothetical protein MAR_012354 [Mya arenaria]